MTKKCPVCGAKVLSNDGVNYRCYKDGVFKLDIATGKLVPVKKCPCKNCTDDNCDCS